MHLQLVTPTYRPVGGVVKLMDYADHAIAKGWEVTVLCPEPWTPDLDVFRSRGVPGGQGADVDFVQSREVDTTRSDYVLISLPTDYEKLRFHPDNRSPERVIHIIQNVRHVNPVWLDGYGLRLLTRPMSRISTNTIVSETISPFLDDRAFHEVITLGHDTSYFTREGSPRTGGPMRIGYTTWKSDVGHRVAALLDDIDVEFRAITTQATWAELRELYHWADVFLCSPGPEEGFYMPGLEAMAAGCFVVTPDVGGNMAYARPGDNCILVDYGDAEGYAKAVRELAEDREAHDHLRAGGLATATEFSLSHERALFHSFLDKLTSRVARYEAPPP